MKKALIELGKSQIDEKLASIELELKNLNESSNSETKSSMGDKYETSREMITQERNKFESQKSLLLQQRSFLMSIDVEKAYDKVEFGALVYADQAIYFVCTALGKLVVGNQSVFAVSANSPIAQSMLGKGVGSAIQFNNQSFVIRAIA